MTKSFTRQMFSLLAILLLAPWPVAHYVHKYNDNITGQNAVQLAPVRLSTTSGVANRQDPARGYRSIPKVRDYVENNPSKEFLLQAFVTPEDQVVKALAAQINGVEEAYKVAVQWTYVSEQKLNHVADKWLTPHEFLANTPNYPSNPQKGGVVSDCEEQAHTLVSLIRAQGIRPEAVRVVLGEVRFDGEAIGHAWVELLTNGHWLTLDPSSGPYWDDKAERIVRRRGLSFSYYASHTYPVLQVHVYYNDIYYFDLRDGSENAPASWLNFTQTN